MKIAIIGTGNMGEALARLWAAKGHEISISFSRDKSRLEAKAQEFGVAYGEVKDVVAAADAVLLSVPWAAVPEAIKQAGDLSGKLLISCCTPLKADLSGLEFGTDDSGAEFIQRLAPDALIVESFNSVFATILQSGDVQFGEHKTTVFYCGDDAKAKATVASLIEEIGCEAVDAGPLTSARFLEPMGNLMVRMALELGLGPNLNLALLRR